MKKNLGSKQKKSYHELIEEQEVEKAGFKRSELPKKKPVILVEETEKPAASFKPSSKKGYLPNDPDRNEKEFRPRNNYDNKKPYTPRSTSGDSSSSKPYSPKPSYGSSNTPSKPYQPRSSSGQSSSNNSSRPKYPTNQNRFNKPNNK